MPTKEQSQAQRVTDIARISLQRATINTARVAHVTTAGDRSTAAVNAQTATESSTAYTTDDGATFGPGPWYTAQADWQTALTADPALDTAALGNAVAAYAQGVYAYQLVLNEVDKSAAVVTLLSGIELASGIDTKLATLSDAATDATASIAVEIANIDAYDVGRTQLAKLGDLRDLEQDTATKALLTSRYDELESILESGSPGIDGNDYADAVEAYDAAYTVMYESMEALVNTLIEAEYDPLNGVKAPFSSTLKLIARVHGMTEARIAAHADTLSMSGEQVEFEHGSRGSPTSNLGVAALTAEVNTSAAFIHTLTSP